MRILRVYVKLFVGKIGWRTLKSVARAERASDLMLRDMWIRVIPHPTKPENRGH